MSPGVVMPRCMMCRIWALRIVRRASSSQRQSSISTCCLMLTILSIFTAATICSLQRVMFFPYLTGTLYAHRYFLPPPLCFRFRQKAWDADHLFSLPLNNASTAQPPHCDIISPEKRFSLPLRNRFLQQVFAAFGLWAVSMSSIGYNEDSCQNK